MCENFDPTRRVMDEKQLDRRSALFRIQGFGMSRVSRLPDGRFQNLHREVVFYLDLKEDRILVEPNMSTEETYARQRTPVPAQ